MTEPDDLLARLRKAAAAFLALRHEVLACEPWPLAASIDSSPEANWGPHCWSTPTPRSTGAVVMAYGWSEDAPRETMLARLLVWNLRREPTS